MNSQTAQPMSAPAIGKTGQRSVRRRRQPYAWLGASALTLGVGVAVAGAGAAHADDTVSTDATRSAKTSAPVVASRSAVRAVGDGAATPQTGGKRAAATAPQGRSGAFATLSGRVPALAADSPAFGVATSGGASTTAPIAKQACLWAAAVQLPPRAGTSALGAGAPRLGNIWGPASLNPAHFGPVLAPVVWALTEAQYQLQGLTPLARPNQLPSAPGQAQVVGALNTVSPFGAPVEFAVTNAPANGTVTIDSQGFYTYTPDAALAATGGTDTFAVTATDTGFHLENLFGLSGHTVTMTVPVTVAPQGTQPQVAADLLTYHVYNTSWTTQSVNGASYSYNTGAVAEPAVGTQFQTGQSADFTMNWTSGVYGSPYISVILSSGKTSPPGTLQFASILFSQYLVYPYSPVQNCSTSGGVCSTGGTSGSIYVADAPGTVYTVPAAQAQQQSDVLQNLVADDLSNATFYTKSQPTIGYTNPLKVLGFSPYTNNTQDNSTNTYTVSQTTSKTDSSSYNVSVKVTEEAKLGLLTSKAELGAQYTWGTTTANSLTYTQAVTQTIRPGYTIYLYTETPVYRYYGDWSVVYGNTTYILNDVWFDSPNPVTGSYPSYLSAYTCEAGSADCAQLAAGSIPASYPNAWPDSANYPVAESQSANATVSSDQARQRQRWGRLSAVNA